MDERLSRQSRVSVVQDFLRCATAMLAIGSHTAFASSGIEPQIVNGSLTSAWPGIGAVIADASAQCSATLIAPQWVLTAAHCVVGFNNFTFSGATNINNPNTVFYTADAAMSDPSYNENNVFNGHDIGLLHFPAPLPAMPLRLSDNRTLVRVGDRIALMGYGFNNSNGTGDGLKRLGFATLSVLSNHVLEFDNGPASACDGDSGGPAFVLGADGFPTLVGVISFGSQTCDLTGADVLPDVLTYIQAAVPQLCLTSTTGAPCEGVFRDGFDAPP